MEEGSQQLFLLFVHPFVRFLAGRPNRGMVQDMLQVGVMENMPSIKSVRGLGKHFFQIELGDDTLAQLLVELKVLELNTTRCGSSRGHQGSIQVKSY